MSLSRALLGSREVLARATLVTGLVLWPLENQALMAERS